MTRSPRQNPSIISKSSGELQPTMQVRRLPCESSRLSAAAPAAIHLRPRFVHAQWLAMKIFAVERRDGSQRMGLARHLDEAEAFGCTAEQLAHYLHFLDLTELFERIGEFRFGDLRRQIAYENVHAASCLKFSNCATRAAAKNAGTARKVQLRQFSGPGSVPRLTALERRPASRGGTSHQLVAWCRAACAAGSGCLRSAPRGWVQRLGWNGLSVMPVRHPCQPRLPLLTYYVFRD